MHDTRPILRFEYNERATAGTQIHCLFPLEPHTETQSYTAGLHTAVALMRLQAHTKHTSKCTLPQVTFAYGHCLWNTNKIVILKICAHFSFHRSLQQTAIIKMYASPSFSACF